ncbi:porin family protein [Marinibactrum halimedae]|uniref:Outer membrane protein beta-barrel domain-containing protein n=1 Tax=Marinibactrum halimedae TaxID=1444977 RepID=A0AA37T896_9GAMM|nr:porin family protein [Marinibactrum halimedae]MCD9459634.1 porin family protein [Marinibactrum halimedae]GLS25661.1 hypothetical protein GCM10007877_13750 [Marinibactrum halimedae]
MFKKALMAATIAMATSITHAEGMYFGLSAGQSSIDISEFDDETSFTLSLGKKFSDYFAVEVAYSDLGEFEASFSDENFEEEAQIDVRLINLSAVGILPLSDSFELFAKAGVTHWRTSLDSRSIDGNFMSSIEIDNSGSDLSLGAGATAHLSDNFSLSFEYMLTEMNPAETDDYDVSNVSLGARWNF